MARETLTGSRIRDRRLMLGLRQAELARAAGISASYLNLIEHNRRRIGGKLLIAIARELRVEPSALTEGAEAALLAALKTAATEDADGPGQRPEIDRVEEFAGRFPGWAQLLADLQRHKSELERTVQRLSDRLTHDPQIASGLHELLSNAAAIRSTASILADGRDLDNEWRDRFHRNLDQDSRRLADSSKALFAYLDSDEPDLALEGTPHQSVEAFVLAHDCHFPDLETGATGPETITAKAPELKSDAARKLALRFLTQYAQDAAALPIAAMKTALSRCGDDPEAIARDTDQPLPVVLRRLAMMPEHVLSNGAGLIICDAAGTILFRKPVLGFSLPRFVTPDPCWPLYLALSRPTVPVRRQIDLTKDTGTIFDCIAVAWAERGAYTDTPLFLSAMLALPVRAPR